MTRTILTGDDVTLDITLTDADGAAVDLSGTEITWGAATSSIGDPALTKTRSGGGVTVTDATGGVIEVTLGAADTGALSRGRYYHEVQVVDDNGLTTTFVPDAIEVAATVID